MATRKHAIYRAMNAPPRDAAEGACFVSGAQGAGVDTGALVWDSGTLFLSNNVIKELAEVAGFSVNEEGQRVEEENAHLTHENETLRTRIEELEGDLDAVGVLLARGLPGSARS